MASRAVVDLLAVVDSEDPDVVALVDRPVALVAATRAEVRSFLLIPFLLSFGGTDEVLP